MEFSQSLKKNHEFRRIYARGKSAANTFLVLYYRKNKLGINRVGITVGGKVGGAVVRNLVRRRIRESYRLNEFQFTVGYDIIIVARVRAAEATYAQINQALLNLGRTLGLLRPAEGKL